MKKLSDLIKRNANTKIILIYLLLIAVFGTLIMTKLFGLFEFNSDLSLDPLLYYSKDTFYNTLMLLGKDGRVGYLGTHIPDYFFMFFFHPIFSLLIAALLISLKKTETKLYDFLIVFPLFALLFDFLENLFMDIHILIYPDEIQVLGSISGYVTMLKFIVINITLAIIISLCIIKLIQKTKSLNKQ